MSSFTDFYHHLETTQTKQTKEKQSMYVAGSAETRAQQVDLIAKLPEPFTPEQYATATGKSSAAAASQFRRWLKWGWMEKIGPGQYARTDKYGTASRATREVHPPLPADGIVSAKLPDSAAEGKDDAWVAANYKRFHTQSRIYKRGWFMANKDKTKNYWKGQTKARRTKRTEAARAALAAKNGAHTPQQQSSDAVACKLAECPHCGTRFYMVKGSQ